MGDNYIPDSDSKFNLWQSNLLDTVVSNTANWHIPAGELTDLIENQKSWEAAYAIAANRTNRTQTDVQRKNDARKAYKKNIRVFVLGYLAFNSNVTDSDRERMGLAVRSGNRTRVGIPESTPAMRIDFSTGMRHTTHYVDRHTGSKVKPKGVRGCEIWVKVGGDAPEKDSDFSFLCVHTKTPCVINYSISDIGKRAFYRSRWINNRGEQGPWSEIVSAIIMG